VTSFDENHRPIRIITSFPRIKSFFFSLLLFFAVVQPFSVCVCVCVCTVGNYCTSSSCVYLCMCACFLLCASFLPTLVLSVGNPHWLLQYFLIDGMIDRLILNSIPLVLIFQYAYCAQYANSLHGIHKTFKVLNKNAVTLIEHSNNSAGSLKISIVF